VVVGGTLLTHQEASLGGVELKDWMSKDSFVEYKGSTYMRVRDSDGEPARALVRRHLSDHQYGLTEIENAYLPASHLPTGAEQVNQRV
jgi:hypothetical protein